LSPNGHRLTVSEVLAEMNRPGSGPAIQANLFRAGGISLENAVWWVTCAILHRRGEAFDGWRLHAPAVRAALTRGGDARPTKPTRDEDG
jgi:hypothetical protein